MTETLGIVGTGNLGGAIVAGLLKAGFDVAIFDTDAKAMAALKEQGARPRAAGRAVGDAVRAEIRVRLFADAGSLP